MSKKIVFNSKHANGGEYSGMSDEELEQQGFQVFDPTSATDEDLEQQGFQVIEPTPATYETEQTLRNITEQNRTKGRNNKQKESPYLPSRTRVRTFVPKMRPPLIDLEPDAAFSPWRTRFPSGHMVTQRPQVSPIKKEDRVEQLIVKPKKWLDQYMGIIQQVNDLTKNRTEKRKDSNVSNRAQIAAAGAHADQVLREEFPCDVCGGAFNGGNKLIRSINPWERRKQKFCPGCMNHGYVLTRECPEQCGGKNPDCLTCDGKGKIRFDGTPAELLSNLQRKLSVWNRAVYDHIQNCTPWTCAHNCQLNAPHPKTGTRSIDALRKAAQDAGKNLRDKDAWKITHPVPGASPDTISLTAPYALNDQLKPLSHVFSFLGGREGSPLGFGDAVVFTNHDTLNPTADFTTGRDPHYVQPGFQTFHPGGSWDNAGNVSSLPPARVNFSSDEAHQKALEMWNAVQNESTRGQDQSRFRESPFRQTIFREDESLSRGYRSKGQTGFIVHAPKHGRWVRAVVFGNSLDDIRDERGGSNGRLKNNRREIKCDKCNGHGEIYGKNDVSRECGNCQGRGTLEKGLDRGMRMNTDEAFDTHSYPDESKGDRDKRLRVIGRLQRRWNGVVNFIGERSPIENVRSKLKVSVVQAPVDQFTRLTDANSAQFMTIGHFAARRSGYSRERSYRDIEDEIPTTEADAFKGTVIPLDASTCNACKGKKRINNAECSACEGTGYDLSSNREPNQTIIYNILHRKGHSLDTDSLHRMFVTTDNNYAKGLMSRFFQKADELMGRRAGQEGAITPVMLGGHRSEYSPELPTSSSFSSPVVKSRGITIKGAGDRSLTHGVPTAQPPVAEEPAEHDIDQALGHMEDAFFGNCAPGCNQQHTHVRERFDHKQQADAITHLLNNGLNVGKALNSMDAEEFPNPEGE
jgi:DnaJ-class molecular chaperone